VRDPLPNSDQMQVAKKIVQSGAVRFDESYLDSIIGAVHGEVNSNWNAENEVVAAVLQLTLDSISSNQLIAAFSRFDAPDTMRRLLLMPMALEQKNPSVEELLKFDRLFAAHGGDRLGYGYFDAIKRWSTRFPDHARILLRASLEADHNGNVVSRRRLPLLVIEGLATAARDDAHCLAALTDCIATMRQGNLTDQSTLVFAVPALLRGEVLPQSEAEEEIIVALASTEEQLRIAALSSIRALNQKPLNERLSNGIRSVLADGRTSVTSAALAAVQPIDDSPDLGDQLLVGDVLRTFNDCDVSNDDLAHQLCWFLYGVARVQPQLTIDFLRSWAERAGHTLSITHSKRFLHLLQSLDPQMLTDSVLNWIVQDATLVRAALELIRESGSPSFSDAALATLSNLQIEIALLALAAEDHDDYAARLTLCIAVFVLRSRKIGREVHQRAIECMTHAISNYAGNVTALKVALKAARLRRVDAVLKQIDDLHRARSEAWDSATKMHEFRPSAAREMTYRKFDEHFQRLIRSSKPDDPGRYVFSSLFAEVALLGGSSTLQRTETGWIRVPLGTVTAQTELPRFAILDEDAEFIRRVHLKQQAEILRGREE
jgi:hypothetical protein